MEYNPSGKIQRVTRGNLMPPGQCFSCGNPSQQIYALVGWTEFEGAFYVCETCAMAIMTVFPNLMLPSRESVLQGEIARQRKVIESLQDRLSKERKLNESYRAVFSNTGITDPGATRSSDVASPSVNGGSPAEHVLDGTYTIVDEPGPKGSVSTKQRTATSPESGDEEDIARLLEESAVDSGGSIFRNDAPQRDSSEPDDSERPSDSAGAGFDSDDRSFLEYGV